MIEPPAKMVRFLNGAVARHGGSGVIGVAAIQDFELAWTAAAGGRNDTLFQAGSLSKTVTGAVALELVGRGELDLDGDVGERLVSWRFPSAGTTLRDLLGHTSGANVPFYPGYPQGNAVPTLVQSLGGVEPATTPAVEIDPKWVGRFRYSGGGFEIVQQLIEDATGVPFAEAAREVVLDRIPMPRSTFLQPPPEPLRDSAARADWRLYPECAAAGLWTTTDDLARFVRLTSRGARQGGRPHQEDGRSDDHPLTPPSPFEDSGGCWRSSASSLRSAPGLVSSFATVGSSTSEAPPGFSQLWQDRSQTEPAPSS